MAFGVNPSTYPLSTNSGLVPTAYTETPRAESVADATDANGDVAARTYYGGSATIKDCSITLVLKSGSCPTTITLGNATSATQFITNVSLETGSGQWPTYTIQWKEGITNVTGSAFTVTLPTVAPKKCAQALGVDVSSAQGAGTVKLQSTSASFSCEYAEQLDGHGEYAASAFSNGTAESGAEGVIISGNPAWTAATGWTTEDGAAPINETNTAYGTTSASVSKFLAADAVAADSN